MFVIDCAPAVSASFSTSKHIPLRIQQRCIYLATTPHDSVPSCFIFRQLLAFAIISIATSHFAACTAPHVADVQDSVTAMPQAASSEANYGEMDGQRALTEGADRVKRASNRKTGVVAA